jgi:hypothetical protein
LLSDIPAGDWKTANLFLQCAACTSQSSNGCDVGVVDAEHGEQGMNLRKIACLLEIKQFSTESVVTDELHAKYGHFNPY